MMKIHAMLNNETLLMKENTRRMAKEMIRVMEDRGDESGNGGITKEDKILWIWGYMSIHFSPKAEVSALGQGLFD